MRNLSRVLALTAALALIALTVPVSADPLGTCSVRCLGSGFPPVTYTVSTTAEDCCAGSYPNYCPAGSTPATAHWNWMRC